MESSAIDEIDAYHIDREKLMLDASGDRDSRSGSSDQESEVLSLDDHEMDEYYFSDSIDESKAWGSSKRSFYNQENEGSSDEGDELEEKEAISLQDKMAASLTDADFQYLTSIASSEGLVGEQIVEELSALSNEDKLAILERNFPEVSPLIFSFKKSFSSVLHTLLPSCSSASNNTGKMFSELMVHLNLCYCINVMFYLNLKASGQDTKTHPVIGRILSFKQLISQMENLDHFSVATKLKDCPPNDIGDSDEKLPKQDDPLAYYESMRKAKGHVKFSTQPQQMENDEEKRPISYQISRNKGLTPKRHKEQRNPRVKHRNKFKKALVKRKGQVLPVQTELSRYGGESSGIRTNVSRSVKIN